MTQASELRLDADQERVASAGPEERFCVVAGPGSGKTETVSARVAHLTEEGELNGSSLLIISFSRAAVEAIQRRQRANAPHTSAWVTTLDSLASRLLTDAGEEITTLSFDRRIERLIKVLGQDGGAEQLADIEHLIVDEVQDVVGLRADLLASILAKLPDSAGFTLLGDPLQGIYDFQLRPGSLTAEGLRDKAVLLGARTVTLQGQYRAMTKDASRAMSERGGQGVEPWISKMRSYVDGMPRLDGSGIADWITRTPGSIAVLTYSNAHALTLASVLHTVGIRAELLGPAVERPLDPWLAGALGDAPGRLDKDSFLERMHGVDEEVALDRWRLVRRVAAQKQPSVDVERVAQRLAAGIVPTSLYAKRDRVIISTIHRAKGLEFDRVVLLDPDEWHIDDREAFARALYVAITRPRHRLFTFKPGSKCWWKRDTRIDRAVRTTQKGGLLGIEVRASDWRIPEPPDADGDPSMAQATLSSLTGTPTPRPVDVRFRAYGSTSSKPHYDAYLGDVRIGTLGASFTDDLLKRVGRQDRWPRLSGLHLVGTETAAGPVQHGPVGRNGLWLSPLIVGPASLHWRD